VRALHSRKQVSILSAIHTSLGIDGYGGRGGTLRAYSLLRVKSIADDERTIVGIATTPTPDRMGDIVEPKGAVFKLPVPLLFQHDKSQPIGHVIAATTTDAGIEITAQIAKIDQPGKLQDRLDEAWQMLKAGLVGGLSIGFLEKESEPIKGSRGALRFLKWLWVELSVVTVPANAEASITQIKSLDQQQRAASGAARVVLLSPPGVSGTTRNRPETPKGTTVKTTAEQLSEFDTRRKTAVERMGTIMNTAEGRTLDETESEEYDGLQGDVKAIDVHIGRLKAHEQVLLTKATAVSVAGQGEGTSHEARGGIISVRRNIEKGTAFTRYALAVAMAKGNLMHAEKLAERWNESTPEVGMVLKAAVAAGTTSATTWAAPLVQYTNMASEFIELLRPLTIIGRLSPRRVPFNIRIPRQTAGSSGSFVGEGQPKPVNALALDNITMTWAKAAVIIVLTDELTRFSNPAAEALVRADMLAGISAYLDRRFIDPTYAGVANVSPASVTNGIAARQSTGVTTAAITADVKAVLTAFSNANQNLAAGVWVMNAKTALALSLIRNTLDEVVFPTVGITGGTWFGLPVITSNSVGLAGSPTDSFIALIDQSEILLADDGDIAIDMSQEASVEMNDAPSGGATSLVSLWQNNLLGLRAERYINWARRRSTAVAWINDTNY
jgi:HK97 family phage major capsid protein/HK97 family phage prohead protease